MDYTENNHIDILISRYLMGNASSQEIEELFNWIKSSDENKRYFHRQQDIWAVLNPAMDIDDVNTDSAERRVLRKTGIAANRRSFFKRFMFFWSRIAAVALLPLIAFIGFLILRTMDGAPALDDVTITTAFGSMSTTNLPDGSAVWLNANSSLTYSPDMNSGTRDVFLHGEAYFEVRSDAAHPFNVHTPYITVTAKGTEFNVNAYDSTASVTLVNGRVDVEVDDHSLHLNPGEHLAITDGKPVINDNIDTAKYCCWRNGMLIFEDESLLNICNRLQQMYDVEFDIAPELRTRTFRMILNGENISDIVRFFEMSAPVICEFVTQEAPGDTVCAKPKVRIIPS